ncbi:SGNH/GDSL hydrolase family protein [Luteimonas lutimaris]|uniref:SGNH/GDSL hydrolase family protein n=1 Tax=Luteimonas lutimaris TaxID=698645 RepID=A0ABP7M785_9GAMM
MRVVQSSIALLLAALLAALLPGCAGTGPAATATGVAPVPDSAPLDPVSSPQWAADMARFAAEDAAQPPPAHPVVFTGSSSVRMWATLAEDFPGVPVLNRGFGGSQLRDATWYADEVAVRYAPQRIVLYAGDNDIDAKRSPEQVRDDFRTFVARVRRDLPGVPIAWLAIKPSPARIAQLPAQQRANALVKAEAARMRAVDFIDVATPMLDADGRPRAELFGNDQLHMNARGYALWRGVVAPYLR